MEAYPNVYLYRRVVQAKLFIDAHGFEKIDLNNISNEAAFSKFHFIRLFKQMYGYSPHQYLTRVRIDHAKILLKAGLPVTEVCLQIGFESLSSFSGLFKKVVGISPTVYQQQQKQLQQNVKDTPLQFVPNCFAAAKGWVISEFSNFEETNP